MEYDVIVVGAGHAGCEAALATSRLDIKTLLVTSNLKNVADTPCNPSIGGPAKGIVVREIDALGGEMGKNVDKSLLQLKMLNTKKGPAVRALRAQIDKVTYHQNMLEVLEKQENLYLEEAMVEDLIIENEKVRGIILSSGEKINTKIIILTTGTYLKSTILIGSEKTNLGPDGKEPSKFLSGKLQKLGFEIKRLKTGTPARLEKSSIDYSQAIIQEGDSEALSFSYDKKVYYDPTKQEACYLIYTTPDTHAIINQNLERSSMYGGFVEGLGPRYCPSIEDKIVRFFDKDRHQIFLEPESKFYDDIYVQGFSTSMPRDVQDKMIRSLPGLENAIINKYAYAIEYDAIDPKQLKPSLETKLIENLFTAGQINGTSGYEEAACQGLMAGINAVKKLNGEEPLVLKRNEAYIGVLIDDLITKGIIDPYRLLTSRAEYRLLLRHDNADLRLTSYGKKIGLIDEKRYSNFIKKRKDAERLIELLNSKKLVPGKDSEKFLNEFNSTHLLDGITLHDLLKRPEIKIENLQKIIGEDFDKDVLEEVEINIKYAGYITKANKEAQKMIDMENEKIPVDLNYEEIKNIANEAKQKLSEIRPLSLGQASRISGVNPSDINILSLHIKRRKNSG